MLALKNFLVILLLFASICNAKERAPLLVLNDSSSDNKTKTKAIQRLINHKNKELLFQFAKKDRNELKNILLPKHLMMIFKSLGRYPYYKTRILELFLEKKLSKRDKINPKLVQQYIDRLTIIQDPELLEFAEDILLKIVSTAKAVKGKRNKDPLNEKIFSIIKEDHAYEFIPLLSKIVYKNSTIKKYRKKAIDTLLSLYAYEFAFKAIKSESLEPSIKIYLLNNAHKLGHLFSAHLVSSPKIFTDNQENPKVFKAFENSIIRILKMPIIPQMAEDLKPYKGKRRNYRRWAQYRGYRRKHYRQSQTFKIFQKHKSSWISTMAKVNGILGSNLIQHWYSLYNTEKFNQKIQILFKRLKRKPDIMGQIVNQLMNDVAIKFNKNSTKGFELSKKILEVIITKITKSFNITQWRKFTKYYMGPDLNNARKYYQDIQAELPSDESQDPWMLDEALWYGMQYKFKKNKQHIVCDPNIVLKKANNPYYAKRNRKKDIVDLKKFRKNLEYYKFSANLDIDSTSKMIGQLFETDIKISEDEKEHVVKLLKGVFRKLDPQLHVDRLKKLFREIESGENAHWKKHIESWIDSSGTHINANIRFWMRELDADIPDEVEDLLGEINDKFKKEIIKTIMIERKEKKASDRREREEIVRDVVKRELNNAKIFVSKEIKKYFLNNPISLIKTQHFQKSSLPKIEKRVISQVSSEYQKNLNKFIRDNFVALLKTLNAREERLGQQKIRTFLHFSPPMIKKELRTVFNKEALSVIGKNVEVQKEIIQKLKTILQEALLNKIYIQKIIASFFDRKLPKGVRAEMRYLYNSSLAELQSVDFQKAALEKLEKALNPSAKKEKESQSWWNKLFSDEQEKPLSPRTRFHIERLKKVAINLKEDTYLERLENLWKELQEGKNEQWSEEILDLLSRLNDKIAKKVKKHLLKQSLSEIKLHHNQMLLIKKLYQEKINSVDIKKVLDLFSKINRNNKEYGLIFLESLTQPTRNIVLEYFLKKSLSEIKILGNQKKIILALHKEKISSVDIKRVEDLFTKINREDKKYGLKKIRVFLESLPPTVAQPLRKTILYKKRHHKHGHFKISFSVLKLNTEAQNAIQEQMKEIVEKELKKPSFGKNLIKMYFAKLKKQLPKYIVEDEKMAFLLKATPDNFKSDDFQEKASKILIEKLEPLMQAMNEIKQLFFRYHQKVGLTTPNFPSALPALIQQWKERGIPEEVLTLNWFTIKNMLVKKTISECLIANKKANFNSLMKSNLKDLLPDKFLSEELISQKFLIRWLEKRTRQKRSLRKKLKEFGFFIFDYHNHPQKYNPIMPQIVGRDKELREEYKRRQKFSHGKVEVPEEIKGDKVDSRRIQIRKNAILAWFKKSHLKKHHKVFKSQLDRYTKQCISLYKQNKAKAKMVIENIHLYGRIDHLFEHLFPKKLLKKLFLNTAFYPDKSKESDESKIDLWQKRAWNDFKYSKLSKRIRKNNRKTLFFNVSKQYRSLIKFAQQVENKYLFYLQQEFYFDRLQRLLNPKGELDKEGHFNLTVNEALMFYQTIVDTLKAWIEKFNHNNPEIQIDFKPIHFKATQMADKRIKDLLKREKEKQMRQAANDTNVWSALSDGFFQLGQSTRVLWYATMYGRRKGARKIQEMRKVAKLLGKVPFGGDDETFSKTPGLALFVSALPPIQFGSMVFGAIDQLLEDIQIATIEWRKGIDSYDARQLYYNSPCYREARILNDVAKYSIGIALSLSTGAGSIKDGVTLQGRALMVNQLKWMANHTLNLGVISSIGAAGQEFVRLGATGEKFSGKSILNILKNTWSGISQSTLIVGLQGKFFKLIGGRTGSSLEKQVKLQKWQDKMMNIADKLEAFTEIPNLITIIDNIITGKIKDFFSFVGNGLIFISAAIDMDLNEITLKKSKSTYVSIDPSKVNLTNDNYKKIGLKIFGKNANGLDDTTLINKTKATMFYLANSQLSLEAAAIVAPDYLGIEKLTNEQIEALKEAREKQTIDAKKDSLISSQQFNEDQAKYLVSTGLAGLPGNMLSTFHEIYQKLEEHERHAFSVIVETRRFDLTAQHWKSLENSESWWNDFFTTGISVLKEDNNLPPKVKNGLQRIYDTLSSGQLPTDDLVLEVASNMREERIYDVKKALHVLTVYKNASLSDQDRIREASWQLKDKKQFTSKHKKVFTKAHNEGIDKHQVYEYPLAVLDKKHDIMSEKDAKSKETYFNYDETQFFIRLGLLGGLKKQAEASSKENEFIKKFASELDGVNKEKAKENVTSLIDVLAAQTEDTSSAIDQILSLSDSFENTGIEIEPKKMSEALETILKSYSTEMAACYQGIDQQLHKIRMQEEITFKKEAGITKNLGIHITNAHNMLEIYKKLENLYPQLLTREMKENRQKLEAILETVPLQFDLVYLRKLHNTLFNLRRIYYQIKELDEINIFNFKNYYQARLLQRELENNLATLHQLTGITSGGKGNIIYERSKYLDREIGIDPIFKTDKPGSNPMAAMKRANTALILFRRTVDGRVGDGEGEAHRIINEALNDKDKKLATILNKYHEVLTEEEKLNIEKELNRDKPVEVNEEWFKSMMAGRPLYQEDFSEFESNFEEIKKLNFEFSTLQYMRIIENYRRRIADDNTIEYLLSQEESAEGKTVTNFLTDAEEFLEKSKPLYDKLQFLYQKYTLPPQLEKIFTELTDMRQTAKFFFNLAHPILHKGLRDTVRDAINQLWFNSKSDDFETIQEEYDTLTKSLEKYKDNSYIQKWLTEHKSNIEWLDKDSITDKIIEQHELRKANLIKFFVSLFGKDRHDPRKIVETIEAHCASNNYNLNISLNFLPTPDKTASKFSRIADILNERRKNIDQFEQYIKQVDSFIVKWFDHRGMKSMQAIRQMQQEIAKQCQEIMQFLENDEVGEFLHDYDRERFFYLSDRAEYLEDMAKMNDSGLKLNEAIRLYASLSKTSKKSQKYQEGLKKIRLLLGTKEFSPDYIPDWFSVGRDAQGKIITAGTIRQNVKVDLTTAIVNDIESSLKIRVANNMDWWHDFFIAGTTLFKREDAASSTVTTELREIYQKYKKGKRPTVDKIKNAVKSLIGYEVTNIQECLLILAAFKNAALDNAARKQEAARIFKIINKKSKITEWQLLSLLEAHEIKKKGESIFNYSRETVDKKMERLTTGPIKTLMEKGIPFSTSMARLFMRLGLAGDLPPKQMSLIKTAEQKIGDLQSHLERSLELYNQTGGRKEAAQETTPAAIEKTMARTCLEIEKTITELQEAGLLKDKEKPQLDRIKELIKNYTEHYLKQIPEGVKDRIATVKEMAQSPVNVPSEKEVEEKEKERKNLVKVTHQEVDEIIEDLRNTFYKGTQDRAVQLDTMFTMEEYYEYQSLDKKRSFILRYQYIQKLLDKIDRLDFLEYDYNQTLSLYKLVDEIQSNLDWINLSHHAYFRERFTALVKRLEEIAVEADNITNEETSKNIDNLEKALRLDKEADFIFKELAQLCSVDKVTSGTREVYTATEFGSNLYGYGNDKREVHYKKFTTNPHLRLGYIYDFYEGHTDKNGKVNKIIGNVEAAQIRLDKYKETFKSDKIIAAGEKLKTTSFEADIQKRMFDQVKSEYEEEDDDIPGEKTTKSDEEGKKYLADIKAISGKIFGEHLSQQGSYKALLENRRDPALRRQLRNQYLEAQELLAIYREFKYSNLPESIRQQIIRDAKILRYSLYNIALSDHPAFKERLNMSIDRLFRAKMEIEKLREQEITQEVLVSVYRLKFEISKMLQELKELCGVNDLINPTEIVKKSEFYHNPPGRHLAGDTDINIKNFKSIAPERRDEILSFYEGQEVPDSQMMLQKIKDRIQVSRDNNLSELDSIIEDHSSLDHTMAQSQARQALHDGDWLTDKVTDQIIGKSSEVEVEKTIKFNEEELTSFAKKVQTTALDIERISKILSDLHHESKEKIRNERQLEIAELVNTWEKQLEKQYISGKKLREESEKIDLSEISEEVLNYYQERLGHLEFYIDRIPIKHHLYFRKRQKKAIDVLFKIKDEFEKIRDLSHAKKLKRKLLEIHEEFQELHAIDYMTILDTPATLDYVLYEAEFYFNPLPLEHVGNIKNLNDRLKSILRNTYFEGDKTDNTETGGDVIFQRVNSVLKEMKSMKQTIDRYIKEEVAKIRSRRFKARGKMHDRWKEKYAQDLDIRKSFSSVIREINKTYRNRPKPQPIPELESIREFLENHPNAALREQRNLAFIEFQFDRENTGEENQPTYRMLGISGGNKRSLDEQSRNAGYITINDKSYDIAPDINIEDMVLRTFTTQGEKIVPDLFSDKRTKEYIDWSPKNKRRKKILKKIKRLKLKIENSPLNENHPRIRRHQEQLKKHTEDLEQFKFLRAQPPLRLNPRQKDSEVKLLEEFISRYADQPNIEGTIKIYSERQFCKSCWGVIIQFKKMFPNMRVKLYVSRE